jgi:hypothetical protein
VKPLQLPELVVIETGVAPVGSVTVAATPGMPLSLVLLIMNCVFARLPAVTVPGVTDGVMVRPPEVCAVNVAVTLVFEVRVTTQVPVPVQPPPDQPENVDPAAGVADNVTDVPLVNGAEQVEPQLMPAGLLVTVPDPLPDLLTVKVGPVVLKVAVTVVLAFSVT